MNGSSSRAVSDFVITGSLNGKPGIRYVVNGKKSWDMALTVKDKNLAKSVFVEKVWVKNERRSDMMAYFNKKTKIVKLVSLKSRKVLTKPKFNTWDPIKIPFNCKNINFMALQPGLDFTPYLIIRTREIEPDFSNVKTQIVKAHYKQKNPKKKEKENASSSTIFINNSFMKRIKYRYEKVPEHHLEADYFDNLAAMKVSWADVQDFGRKYEDDCYSEMVYVMKINPRKGEGRYLTCLDKITQGVLGGRRIDSLAFLCKNQLMLLQHNRVYFVDWKAQEITRTLELSGLFKPLLNKKIEPLKEIRLVMRYQRTKGRFYFSVGRCYAELTDLGKFESCQEKLDLRFYYSGWFMDNQLTHRKSIEKKGAQVALPDVKLSGEKTEVQQVVGRASEQYEVGERNLRGSKQSLSSERWIKTEIVEKRAKKIFKNKKPFDEVI